MAVSAKYQPWYKRVLIPFWVIQLGFMLFFIITTSVIVQYSLKYGSGFDIVTLSFCCTCLLFDIVEIILFATGRLKPLFYLISQVIKTTLWLVLFIIAMVGVAHYASIDNTSTISITVVIFSIILLSFVATLIYASVIYSRARLGRADRTYSSTPYQDTSTPYRDNNEVPLPPQPAPAHVTTNEIRHEHENAATFEMAGRSTPSPA